MSDEQRILLPRARLSFPELYRPKAFQDGGPGKYQASFLLDPSNAKHAQVIAVVEKKAKELALATFGEVPKGLIYCFGDGNTKAYAGYEDMWYISSSNSIRPGLMDENGVQMEADEAEMTGKFYPGCYVHGSISLWAQNNKWGKRINANLRAVRFAADGEAFGMKPINPVDEFAGLDGDDDWMA